MRILIASGTWYPERNGVARVATEVGRGLARRGHEVTALVPRATGLPREDFDGSLRVLRVIERGRLPLTIKDVVETKKHSRSLGAFDLLMAHGSMTAVGLSSADCSAPLVLVYHASLPRELRFMRSRLPWGHERVVAHLNGPITSMLDRVALRRSARILILSEYTRSLLLSDHLDQSHKIRAVSGGVETAAFRPRDGMAGARRRLGVRAGRRLLVTVRRAEPRMGIEQLLGAVRLLTDDDVDLAVVGGGLLTDELRRVAFELGIDRRVQFVGKVPEEDLHDWYRAADLFVLPTVAYEGFGMVTVEALASGTPVVGTSAGATPELLEPLDSRLVTQGSDPQSLAAAIQEALAFVDDDFRARCRRYAEERFDWDRVMPGWEQALASVASGQNRSWAGQMRFPNGYPQYP